MKQVPLFALLVVFASSLFAQGDYQKGLSYYKQNEFEKAIAEFEAIVKEQPEYEFGHRILGLSYLKLKRYERAAKAFQEALRLKDDNFISYSGLSLAYFNLGRYRETISTLNRAEAHAKSPKDRYQLHRTRGTAAFNIGDFSSAVSDLQKAVSIQRGDLNDLLQLGIAHYQLKQYQEAAPYLQQVVSIDPGNGQATRYLSRLNFEQAVAAIEQKDFSKATDLLRKHLETFPEDGEAWFNLGLAYLFAKNLKAAEEAFLRSTRLTPDHGESHNRLGYIYETTKRYQKALQAYQRAYALTHSADTRESVERVEKRIAQAKLTEG